MSIGERNLPLACTLSATDLAARDVEVGAMFAAVQQVQEVEDGYALRFPGDDAWAARLLDFVVFERRCCAFFTFDLSFEPDSGPIWLRLRGPDGVKGVIEGMLPHRDATVAGQ